MTILSVPITELLSRVSAVFPHTMLDRRLRNRHEVGVAKSRRTIASSVRGGSAAHHYSNCLFQNSEHGLLTGLTILPKVRRRRIANQRFEIVSSAGLSIFHSPEGWVLAALPERTVVLDQSLLMKRGWNLNAA